MENKDAVLLDLSSRYPQTLTGQSDENRQKTTESAQFPGRCLQGFNIKRQHVLV